jgi:hypothetical protein
VAGQAQSAPRESALHSTAKGRTGEQDTATNGRIRAERFDEEKPSISFYQKLFNVSALLLPGKNEEDLIWLVDAKPRDGSKGQHII